MKATQCYHIGNIQTKEKIDKEKIFEGRECLMGINRVQ